MALRGFTRKFSPLKILADREVEQIHYGTLDVLQETGVKVYHDEALKVFEKVISIDPLNLIAIRSLAEIHYGNENWDRALELFEEYLFEYPGDPDIEGMLKKAREKKKNAAREARVTGQDVTFPETGRMASILAAQKNTSESGQAEESQAVPSETTEAEKPVDRAPRSLFNLFTPAECEELGLSAYDK